MLHNHTNYSVIDGRATIDRYLELVEETGDPKFFCITDHGTLGGAIQLYKHAHERGIKPVIGCELYVDANELRETQYPSHITVLAQNEAGYRALIAANNLAHRQYYYRPRLTLRQLIEGGFSRDWLVLSGCMSSPFFKQDMSYAESAIKALASVSGRFMLEVMLHDTGNEEFDRRQWEHLEKIASVHKSTGLPVVITNDCHYADKHDEDFHHNFLKTAKEKGGLEFDGLGFHYKSAGQLQLIADQLGCSDAVDNAVRAVEECNIVIPEADKVSWYVPDITNGSPYETVRALAEPKLAGLPQQYRDRFEYEMATLSTSEPILNSYLVANDVTEWSHSNGIAMAARGSMAGSLVSNLLGITLEDPVRWNLKFERAVNPARPTIPDFDLDVSSRHRKRVLEYLQTRYDHNLPICSYTHYGPKSVLGKLMRMEGIGNPSEINERSKEMPDDWPMDPAHVPVWYPEFHTYDYPLYSLGWVRAFHTERLAGHPVKEIRDKLREREDNYDAFHYNPDWFYLVPQNLRNVFMGFKGLYSTMSIHPAGIIVGGNERPPEYEVPLQWVASSSKLGSSYDMYDIKKLGLFKLDVLGLATLDQLEAMEKFTGLQPPTTYDDPAVLDAFTHQYLAGIFQMDGNSCRKVIKEIGGISDFEDIIAANTLARPGASQFTASYRSGLTDLIEEYPELASVLGYTNGLILYQEQVMDIGRVLADFDDAEQDDIKEAIKYFKHEEFHKNIASKFYERLGAKGVDATNIVNTIVEFSKYTFNRAHACTYSAVAYKQMWYKIYHPAAFYAAVFDHYENSRKLVVESRHFNVEWLPPSVNRSDYYTKTEGNRVRLGLSAVKGIGDLVWESIEEARPYSSLEDFEARVNKRRCNVKVRATLKGCFAFEDLGEQGDEAIFGESIGFGYVYVNANVDDLLQLENWQAQRLDRVSGFIVSIHEFKVKKEGSKLQGRFMANAEIIDGKEVRRLVFFPDVWDKARGTFKADDLVAFEGTFMGEDFRVDKGASI